MKRARYFISKGKFENLIEQTETLSKRIGAFINYLSNSEMKGSKYK